MIHVRRPSTLAAISELRNKTEEVLSRLKSSQVILERHHKPVAVMLDYAKYEIMEKALDFAEDYVLGSLALLRDEGSAKSDFIDIDRW